MQRGLVSRAICRNRGRRGCRRPRRSSPAMTECPPTPQPGASRVSAAPNRREIVSRGLSTLPIPGCSPSGRFLGRRRPVNPQRPPLPAPQSVVWAMPRASPAGEPARGASGEPGGRTHRRAPACHPPSPRGAHPADRADAPPGRRLPPRSGGPRGVRPADRAMRWRRGRRVGSSPGSRRGASRASRPVNPRGAARAGPGERRRRGPRRGPAAEAGILEAATPAACPAACRGSPGLRTALRFPCLLSHDSFPLSCGIDGGSCSVCCAWCSPPRSRCSGRGCSASPWTTDGGRDPGQARPACGRVARSRGGRRGVPVPHAPDSRRRVARHRVRPAQRLRRPRATAAAGVLPRHPHRRPDVPRHERPERGADDGRSRRHVHGQHRHGVRRLGRPDVVHRPRPDAGRAGVACRWSRWS